MNNLRVHEHTNLEHKTGDYKLVCDDCDAFYVGQTGRGFLKRFTEPHPTIIMDKLTKLIVILTLLNPINNEEVLMEITGGIYFEKLEQSRSFSGMITHTIELKREIREKRAINYQDINPLAWIGAGIGRIFGLVSTYDIEDLKVQSDGVSQSIRSLKKVLLAENHRIDQTLDYLHRLKMSTLDILDGILPYMTQFMKHTRGLIYMIGEKQYMNMLHDSCITGYLNVDLISHDELSGILNIYSELQLRNRFHLVLNDLTDYYEFPLISCLSNHKEIRIFFQIPIIFNSDTKDLFNTYLLPFMNGPELCYINFKEGLYGKSERIEYYPEYLKLCSYHSSQCLICPRT